MNPLSGPRIAAFRSTALGNAESSKTHEPYIRATRKRFEIVSNTLSTAFAASAFERLEALATLATRSFLFTIRAPSHVYGNLGE